MNHHDTLRQAMIINNKNIKTDVQKLYMRKPKKYEPLNPNIHVHDKTNRQKSL